MYMRTVAIMAFAVTNLLLACGQKSPEAYREEGKKLFVQEKYAEARECFGKALNSNPSDRELLYLMGMAYRKDQMYDSALSALRRVDLLYPKDREINQNLYDVALALNDWSVARSALKGLMDLNAAPPHPWKLMADLWRRSDHPGNTYYAAKLALLDDPEDIDLWVLAANSAYMVDSAQASLAYIDTAILKFGEKEMLLANRATYLNFVKKHDSAEVIFRGLLAKDTGSVQYQLNLAHSLSEQSSRAKREEAISLYKKVQPKLGPEFKLDSLITDLEAKLK
jgi:tetratricopeptide (TPR) repeat protein